jgi:hypothetical protein
LISKTHPFTGNHKAINQPAFIFPAFPFCKIFTGRPARGLIKYYPAREANPVPEL